MSDERMDDRWIQTISGRRFWPLTPRVQDVDFYDIAHALSMLCRFAGHVSRFYSVAEHSVHLSYQVPDEHRLWALLHDAAEAYVVDVPRPLKRTLPNYCDVETGVLDTIRQAARLPVVTVDHIFSAEVADADTRILLNERAALMPNTRYPWGVDHLEPLPMVLIECWEPDEARKKFLDRFAELRDSASL